MSVKKIQLNWVLKIVFSIFLSFAFNACVEDSSCGTNNETGLLFSMVKVERLANKVSVKRDHALLSVFEFNKTDTVYPRQTDTLSMIPLSLNDTITQYLFIKDSVSDRVNIIHSLPQPGFLDVNCGFVPLYDLKSITFSNNFIDSIYIVYPQVSNDLSITNIFLFTH